MNLCAELTNELYKQTFDQAFLGMVIMNNEGAFVDVNPSFCNMIGYSKAELIKLTLWDFVYTADTDKSMLLHKKLINLEINNFQVENRYLCKNGDVFWAVTKATRLKESPFIYVQIQDIGGQKQKEAKYKERVESYYLMAKNSTDLIMRHAPNGEAFCVSPSSKDIVGFEPEELIGASPFDQVRIHPEDVFRTIKSYQQISLTKQTTKIRYRVRSKIGDYIWVESTAKGIFNPKTNELEEIISVSRDCTDQVIHENELKESEERYRTIVESSKDAIGIYSNGKITFANTSLLKLGNNNDYHKLFDQLAQNILSPKVESLEKDLTDFQEQSQKHQCLQRYSVKVADGTIRELEISANKVLYNGQPAVQFIARDITERKKYEEFLHKVDKLNLVGELAAGVAHEIRNPLTTIKGFIQLFQTTRQYNENYFEMINNECKRVEAIIYEFLTLAKPHKETIYQLENISRILEEVVTLENANALLKNIHLECRYAEEEQLVYCDKYSMKQVLINILQNAIEATDERGSIEISIVKKENSIEIYCKDNGCGIPKNLIHRLGEPFYSLKEKGTGLGLMICFKIIENHNGKIRIDSDVGIGTTVTIQLPLGMDKKTN